MFFPSSIVTATLLVLAATTGSGPNEAAPSGDNAVSTTTTPRADRLDVSRRYLVGGLRITRPRIELGTGDTSPATAFVLIENRTRSPDRLLDATIDGAQKTVVALNEASNDKGSGPLDIAANDTIDMSTAGPHLLVEGFKGAVKDGDRVTGTLHFERAGPLPIEFVVETQNTQPPKP